MLTPLTEEHSLCRHINHQWRDSRGMQWQHGPWVPTVISHRMAAVTEWVFSPLNSETALCVFLISSLFRWCVGKEGSPLCQATRLKSKVGSGCIWVVWDGVRGTGMSTQCTNCLDPCFSMIPRTNNVFLRKIASLQPSLLTVENTEDWTRKWQDYFSLLLSLFCSAHIFDCK